MVNDNIVFVYATLKMKGIREQALKNEDVKTVPAVAFGVTETIVKEDGQRWPTLYRQRGQKTSGENLLVTERQLALLDRWEARYVRETVTTDRGIAWVYLLKEKGKVA